MGAHCQKSVLLLCHGERGREGACMPVVIPSEKALEVQS